MLEQMPKDDPLRPRYEAQLKTICQSLKNLQEPSGCWTVSLLDKASFPKSETSSTALIAYPMAYGIRNGHLDSKVYLPVLKKIWKALVDRVSPDGKLGFVQAVGHDPREIDADHTDAFGLGAFLLAALEVGKLHWVPDLK
jgi:rhamnogalacturonyl hydrolase YesR